VKYPTQAKGRLEWGTPLLKNKPKVPRLRKWIRFAHPSASLGMTILLDPSRIK
jgi:hypothetical protein